MNSRRLRVRLVTPAPPSAATGNGVTARRWTGILRSLGHQVTVEQRYSGGAADVLVALHAEKSAPSIERFHGEHPSAPIVLALTGTDLYGALADSAAAQGSIARASRLVVLQPLAADELPAGSQDRCHVILQSAVPPPGPRRAPLHCFEAAVIAHLRPVKDPLRAAWAARLLPAASRARILHAGDALDPTLSAEARAEDSDNPRYRWLGGIPRWKALRMLARSHLLVLTSRSEGGANVISEALACGVPVLSTAIPGSIGILGADYPGYFPVEDTKALAVLLSRAEDDEAFYADLRERVRQLAPLVDPARERESWDALLRSL